MVATVQILRLTGSGPTENVINDGTTGINTRANAEDTHTTAGTSNPIVVPTSGTNYSFWVVTRLKATVAPATNLTNIKWYTDGTNSFGTGVTCKMNTATGYVQATGTAGTTGNLLNTTNYSTLAGATSDSFTFTSGSPKSVTGSQASTGQFGDYIVYQIEVGTTANPGPTSVQETFSVQYDET